MLRDAGWTILFLCVICLGLVVAIANAQIQRDEAYRRSKLNVPAGPFADKGAEWIATYLDKEDLGFANLQRQRFYTEVCGAVDHKSEPQLPHLRGLYWKHQRRLNRLLDQRPRNPRLDKLARDRQTFDQNGRSRAWAQDQQRCKDVGGCCTSLPPCGCCGRFLSSGRYRVYGRCTLEYHCCRLARRVPLQDSRLPPMDKKYYTYK